MRLKRDYAEAHSALGRLLWQPGEPRTVTEKFDMVVSIAPGYGEAHYNRGLAAGQQGDTGRAVSEFRTALGLKPDCLGARLNLAWHV